MTKSTGETARSTPRLSRFLDRVLKRNNAGRAPTLIPRDEHNISRRNISEAALKVIARLRGGGYQAYLVGGGVRDMLLGLQPTDFDVATNATPEQVRKLFGNSRIIGRRFKIVHVRFGREIIEVTTFRSQHEGNGRASEQAINADGMLLRDNIYGTIEEDARRRDFTVNALYYTTEDFAVHDYVSGMKDLQARQIRIIGDPETRFREDPVRMLRAVRFAARLGFSIEPGTAEPIVRLRNLLQGVPPARLFDEVLKLFMSGHGVTTCHALQHYHLFEPLFPLTTAALAAGHPTGEALIHRALASTDERIATGQPVTPAFLFAALLWPPLQLRMAELEASGVPELPALHAAASEIIEQQVPRVAIPRRFTLPMREIWELQFRLPRRTARRVQGLLDNRRLRAAYDFLLLREQAGEELDGLGQWWTDFLDADEGQREQLLQVAQQGAARPRRRRRRPRR